MQRTVGTMDEEQLRERAAAARVARLATVRPDGRPHLVPITFALDGDRLVTAIDDKPKSTRELQRLANIRNEPRVAVLIDHYDEDWSRLWWVRVDGEATIEEAGPAFDRAVRALADRYPAYRRRPPEGPVIVIGATAWSGWSASP